jgi:hypothetical protein
MKSIFALTVMAAVRLSAQPSLAEGRSNDKE